MATGRRCGEAGVNLVIGGVFNSGILALPDPHKGTFDYRPVADNTAKLVADLQAVCLPETDIVTAALNFPLRSQIVTSVLVGTSRISSISECGAKVGAAVPARIWREIDDRLSEERSLGIQAQ